jgi:hypothetical protein
LKGFCNYVHLNLKTSVNKKICATALKLCKGTYYYRNKRINDEYFSFFMNFVLPLQAKSEKAI